MNLQGQDSDLTFYVAQQNGNIFRSYCINVTCLPMRDKLKVLTCH